MKSAAHAWLPVSALLFLSACSSGPSPRTYVLTPPVEDATLVARAASPSERMVVRRVLVPDYLDTTDIVLRDGRNEVKPSSTGRWAERLSEGLTQALAADLVLRLRSETVVSATPAAAPEQLLITVDALDLWRDGHCVLSANWTIVDHGVTHPVASGTGTFAVSPAGSTAVGDAQLVDAVSRTVAKLADRIVLDIRQTSEHAGVHTD